MAVARMQQRRDTTARWESVNPGGYYHVRSADG